MNDDDDDDEISSIGRVYDDPARLGSALCGFNGSAINIVTFVPVQIFISVGIEPGDC